jgi:hypothetical protein
MAPRVTRTAAAAPSPPLPQPQPRGEMAKTLARLRGLIEANCEDVGSRFAEEARRIHFGEKEPRGIYGEASSAEAAALKEDGIDYHVLPWWQRRDD